MIKSQHWVSALYFFCLANSKCNVENIHISSLTFKSIIDINATEDSPGCEPVCTICIKPFHNGLLGFKSQEQLQKSEIVLSSSQNKCFSIWYLIGECLFIVQWIFSLFFQFQLKSPWTQSSLGQWYLSLPRALL